MHESSPSSPVDAIAAALPLLRLPRAPHDHAPHHNHAPHHDHPRHGDPRPGVAGRRGGPARFRLLETLAGAAQPLSVGEVAEALGVDQPRASRLVQQAVEMRWAQREADPADARRIRLVLTDEGREIAERLRHGRRDAVRTALEEFSDDERAELARLLTKFAAAWPGVKG